MFANASRRSRAHVDVPLILMVFAMCFFGIYAVCVATYSINSTATNLLEHILESSSTLRQCFFVLVLAPLVMTLIILCPYHLIRRSRAPCTSAQPCWYLLCGFSTALKA